jgi:membrane-associated protease RseP (regulator of RpoE activity)
MRRLHVLLVTAGLLAAPVSAVAGPGSSDSAGPDDPWSETFEWSTSASPARLGVMVIGLTPELRKHFGAPGDRGVMIAKVEPKSAAEAAGLAVGDIVTEVKGEAVDSAEDVLAALASTKKDDSAAVTVIRDRKPMAMTVRMLNDPAPRAAHKDAWPPWIEQWFRGFRPVPPPHHHAST